MIHMCLTVLYKVNPPTLMVPFLHYCGDLHFVVLALKSFRGMLYISYIKKLFFNLSVGYGVLIETPITSWY